MKIRLQNSPLVCEAAKGETILLACARSGVIISAPCGGRGTCGKCGVRLLEGQVSGDTPDAEGAVRACAAVPLSDITIDCPAFGELSVDDSGKLPAAAHRPARSGIALDIGTTTVCARLVDLDTSTALDNISELNDQRPFGADVMSRIGAAKYGKTGEKYNIGGESEYENIELLNILINITAKKTNINADSIRQTITFVKDRPGHDIRYAINCSKIKEELKWKQTVSFYDGLSKTVDWYLENEWWLERIMSGKYRKI